MLFQDIEKLQETLGYHFTDISVLKEALTHSSVGSAKDYERLEFLGDRVLGLVMAHLLYDVFPTEPEGHLAKRHAALVQGTALAEVAREIDLGAFMQFSDGERAAGGAENDNILADGMEAVIGALYLDQGLDPCTRLIKDLWGERVHILKKPPRDPKTSLQEWAQGRGLPLPAYTEQGRTGPDHAPEFEIQVYVEGFEAASAKGASRRSAEKEAACLLLERLEESEIS